MQVPLLTLRPGQDAVAAWRAAGAPKEVALRLPGPVEACLGQLHPLARRARVWLEAVPQDGEEALDWAVAGAAQLVFAWPLGARQAQLAAELGDLAAVVCGEPEAPVVCASLPDAVVAVQADGGYKVVQPDPAAKPADGEKAKEDG